MYDSLRQLAAQYGLILGSRSPRRVSLLAELGLPFTQIISDLEEDRHPGEHPYDYARRLAEDKARLIGGNSNSQQVVLGCDTVVVMGDRVLGKPADVEEAFETLTALSGHEHVVCTALALARGENVLASGYELTTVLFNAVTAEQIWRYIATGEPMDKAGAYGIQGMGSFLVDSIEGNLDNVVGLPRTLLERLAGEVIFR